MGQVSDQHHDPTSGSRRSPRPDPAGGEQRGPVAQLARLFLVQLAAVIGIATAIVVVVSLTGLGGDGNVSAVAPSPGTTGADGASSSSAGAGSTPSPSTTPGSGTKSSSTESTAGSSAPESPPASSSAPGVPAAVKVDVLNQSAPSGTAEDVAKRLRKAGWTVGRVDDFRGNVSVTTVYWLDPQHRRQARQVSRFLGGVRVQEGFDTLVDGRVTVVLVKKR